MLAAVGFILIVIMVALIMSGKIALPPILILLPVIASLVLGYGFKDIKGFLDTGLGSVLNTAVLFSFAVIYFNVLGDAGMFDLIVGKVMQYIGNSIPLVLIMTCLLTMISHLDGSGATTMLITIPTMLPLFQKMKIKPTWLLFYVGLVSGVENMLPWTSAQARVAAATNVDAYEIWRMVLPIQIVGFVILLASCFFIGNYLKRQGCGVSDEEFAELKQGIVKEKEPVLKVSKTVMAIDIIMTIVLVLAMLFKLINTNLAFMVGLSIALILNCKSAKEQTAQIKKHGSNALNMVMMIFAIGVLVGTLKDTGMMQAMTDALLGILPKSAGRHIPMIVALFSVPLSMAVGSDTVYMVMTPIFGQMAMAYGGTMEAAVIGALIGSCIAANLCLVGPTPYLALGLAGVDMKDNLRANFLPTWILGIVLALVAGVLGVIPF
ncbi:MAG: SLC13 family permease [Oribacterium sp.]|nr:SLC13 family permease [Oribacterium sp.]